ncbi:MAG TPA: ATP synthase F1 subunit epsilon [Kofleriaceae bacterium]
MASAFLAVNLVTPKGVVAHQDTDSVQAPGEMGEFQLLPGHVPLLTALKPGVLTIGSKASSVYAVSSGYLRVDPQGAVEILVEQALPAMEIDVDAARKDAANAQAELAKWGTTGSGSQDGDYQNLVARAGWAQALVSAAGRAAH